MDRLHAARVAPVVSESLKYIIRVPTKSRHEAGIAWRLTSLHVLRISTRIIYRLRRPIAPKKKNDVFNVIPSIYYYRVHLRASQCTHRYAAPRGKRRNKSVSFQRSFFCFFVFFMNFNCSSRELVVCRDERQTHPTTNIFKRFLDFSFYSDDKHFTAYAPSGVVINPHRFYLITDVRIAHISIFYYCCQQNAVFFSRVT